MPDAFFQLENTALAGRLVRLEPYAEALKAQVGLALDCDAEAWDLFSTSGQGEHFEAWWRNLNFHVRGGHWIAYAIRTLADNQIVGTSSFLNIKPERQSAEIGATFLRPDVRSTLVNAEAKLLMLEHAFRCGARRIELLTDLRNLRSQAAIAKLGAQREGVLRRDRVTWTGHIRDTMLFSITDLDWPGVQQKLIARLSAA